MILKTSAKYLTGFASLLFLQAGILSAETSLNQSASEDAVKWEKGWIAQSFVTPIGEDMPRPGDRPLTTWLDTGNGLFSTDYLFAHSGDKNYIFNVGIL